MEKYLPKSKKDVPHGSS